MQLESDELAALRKTFSAAISAVHAKRMGDIDDKLYDDDAHHKAATAELREKLGRMVVIARAKVTRERIYSAAYHPDPTKDLVFFGGELGVSLARWESHSDHRQTRRPWHLGCPGTPGRGRGCRRRRDRRQRRRVREDMEATTPLASDIALLNIPHQIRPCRCS